MGAFYLVIKRPEFLPINVWLHSLKLQNFSPITRCMGKPEMFSMSKPRNAIYYFHSFYMHMFVYGKCGLTVGLGKRSSILLTLYRSLVKWYCTISKLLSIILKIVSCINIIIIVICAWFFWTILFIRLHPKPVSRFFFFFLPYIFRASDFDDCLCTKDSLIYISPCGLNLYILLFLNISHLDPTL